MPHRCPNHTRRRHNIVSVLQDYSPNRAWSDLDLYLKAAHLPAGKTVPATVGRIEFQTVHPRPGHEEIKPVMYLAGKQKGLILTSTNQDFLRASFGDDLRQLWQADHLASGPQDHRWPWCGHCPGFLRDTIIVGLPG